MFFQNKTFTVSYNGKTGGLTLDWNTGFSLHEADCKTPLWQYKFSQLRGSSDDGKSKLKLHFQDTESRAIETKVGNAFTSSLYLTRCPNLNIMLF